jgi:hypothetical protein
MSETKESIAAERDQLREENAALRAQLAAAGQPRGAYQPAQTFQLSEGERQELERYGVANVGGRRMTREEVFAKLGDDQQTVEIGEPSPALDQRDSPLATRPQSAVPGVDYVYPSVAPGEIDPAVAGTPGISGPPATNTTGRRPADDNE